MKKPETTATFIMICIVALVAAYGIGFCINEIKASRIEAAQNKILIQEIKQIESQSSGNETQDTAYSYTQNRNTRTNTARGTQNQGQRDFSPMMEQGRQMTQGFGNQGMNNKGMSMFSDPSVMGMRNSDQQSMFNNFAFNNNQDIPGSQEAIEEPINDNQQGGF
ncbi:MAG: hypothetical protein JXA96_03210 [Sedimentisphaerales bacterium]|nr:hypothetical protein [Sedimentisphaerales bacterium]